MVSKKGNNNYKKNIYGVLKMNKSFLGFQKREMAKVKKVSIEGFKKGNNNYKKNIYGVLHP